MPELEISEQLRQFKRDFGRVPENTSTRSSRQTFDFQGYNRETGLGTFVNVGQENSSIINYQLLSRRPRSYSKREILQRGGAEFGREVSYVEGNLKLSYRFLPEAPSSASIQFIYLVNGSDVARTIKKPHHRFLEESSLVDYASAYYSESGDVRSLLLPYATPDELAEYFKWLKEPFVDHDEDHKRRIMQTPIDRQFSLYEITPSSVTISLPSDTGRKPASFLLPYDKALNFPFVPEPTFYVTRGEQFAFRWEKIDGAYGELRVPSKLEFGDIQEEVLDEDWLNFRFKHPAHLVVINSDGQNRLSSLNLLVDLPK